MGHCEPPCRACGAAWHLRSVSAPAGESRQFALPISPSSVAVFRRNSFRLAFVRRSARVESWDRSRWLADPLRLSAEGAPPDGETSGALCRGIALTRRLQTSSRSPAAVPPFGATTTATTPGPESPTPVRTPSLRCPEHLPSDRDTTLRSRETRSRSLKWSRASSRTLFARCDPARLVRVGAVRPGYSPLARFALRLPSRSRRRCFSPTSATDLSTRAPAERSTSGPAASCSDRLRPTCRTEVQPSEPRAASNRLAAIRPQMATHLTARNQLRLHRPRLPRREPSAARERHPRRRGVITRLRGRRIHL